MLRKLTIRIILKLALFTILAQLLMCYASLAAVSETQNKMLDPLWLCTVTILFLFGISSWSINRNIKNIDDRISENKIDTDKELAELKKSIGELYSGQRDLCGKISRLQGAHDERAGKGTCI